MRRLLVRADLPDELLPLKRVAMNLWHSWNPDVARLFQSLDPELWEECQHNPALVLSRLSKERTREIVNDQSYIERIMEIESRFEDYVGQTRHYSFNLERPIDYSIAYFSMEFGLNESVPIYSGGLGILAGDHLKSSSNLNVPLMGVGLLYQRGYFKQYLSIDGWQQETYPNNDFFNMPVQPVMDGAGNQASFHLDVGGDRVKTLIWKIQVGRIPLYLLDTSDPSNSVEGRKITAELYGGDLEMRIRQEITLGIGGAKALHLLGFWPFVYHLNEGHAAFAALERTRQSMVAYGAPFEVALEAVASSTVFTTHTPVPAGIDLFPPDLIKKYLTGYMGQMGLSVDDLLDLGREDPTDKQSAFSMAVLAIRLSRGCNGVSELHGHVSRKMFKRLWPNVDEQDTPIGHVTNGVHIPSYVSQEMAELIVRYLGEGWIEEPDNKKIWARMQTVPHAELWAAHETRRDRLVAFCRQRLVNQIKARGGSRLDIRRAHEVLNPEALTIGFARRFAPYKRAWLLFRDPERLQNIIGDKARPVQFIFAGKAHPRDNYGKEIIQQVVLQARQEGFRNKLVFLEDYDINLARYMLQGVDVWLNNPRRPMEACGTSGMKAAANGALNVSILDGWWAEAYHEGIGWAIGKGEEFQDQELQDQVDAEYLYKTLENEVIPTFFHRGPDGHPHRWIEMMKNTMAYCCGEFNSHRMVEDYLEKYYIQAGLAHQILGEKKMNQAREFVNWKHRVRKLWKDLKVLDIQAPHGGHVTLGSDMLVEADVHLGELREEEVVVDLCYGRIDPETEEVSHRDVTAMWAEACTTEGVRKYVGSIPCNETGIYSYNIRILPFHPYLFNPLSMNLTLWV